MSRSKPWIKPLNVSLNDYESWAADTPPGESVTFWALNAGKIKAQDYLLWAREHYHLPVIKDSYFKDHCNQQLWNQIQSVANWSPQLLPLDQWDGVVYVGCVEPPEDVSWSFPVVFVLANARSLKSHWKKFTSTQAVESQDPIEMPDDSNRNSNSEPILSVEPTELAEPDELPEGPSFDASEPPPLRFGEQEEPTDEVEESGLSTPDLLSLDAGNFTTAEAEVSDSPETSEFNGAFSDDDTNSESGFFNPESSEPILTKPGTPPPIPKITVEEVKPAPAEDIDQYRPKANVDDGSPIGLDIHLATNDSIDDTSPEGLSFKVDTKSKNNDNAPEGITIEVSANSTSEPDGLSLTDDDLPAIPKTSQLGTDGSDKPQTATTTGSSQDLPFPKAPTTVPTREIPLSNDGPEPNHESAHVPDAAPTSIAKNEPKKFQLKFDQSPEEEASNIKSHPSTLTRFSLTATGLNKEAPDESVINTEKLAPHTSDAIRTEDEAIAWLFSELKQTFQISMILIYNEKQLKPWKWETHWEPKSKDAFQAFDPDQPGLFRILVRTKHPYHGYLVESELNEKFFKNWGFETMPEHVTALPLNIDNHKTGIILSVGEKTCSSERTLQNAMKVVDEFLEAIKGITEKAA